MVSSALETSVGIAAGVALAAALPELPYACGLATVSHVHVRGRRRTAAACRRVPAGQAAWSRIQRCWTRLRADAARTADVGSAYGPSRITEEECRMNPSTAFATVVVDELIRCGVREAVRGPGLAQRAAGAGTRRRRPDGRLRLHVRIDERTAGFLAIGLIRGTGLPVPVRDHLRYGGGQPAPGCPGGVAQRAAVDRAERRPTAGVAGERCQPDHRPAQGVRLRGPAVPRDGYAGARGRPGRVLALAGRPGRGQRQGRTVRRSGAGATQLPVVGAAGTDGRA